MDKDLQFATNAELLASLLGMPAEKLGAVDLTKILSAPRSFEGVGEKRAEKIYVVKEVVRRIMETPASYPMIVHGPEDVYHFMRPRLVHETKEHFLIVILNTKNSILATPTISVGSLTASVVHPREIFSEALKYPCASIILVHNHPSGNSEPSREDIAVTKRIQSAGKVLDIPVLDHIIVGEHTFSSLKEKGLMSND